MSQKRYLYLQSFISPVRHFIQENVCFFFFFFTFYLCLAQFTKNIFNPMGLIIIPQISLNVWTEVHVEHKSTSSSGDAEGMSLLSRGH